MFGDWKALSLCIFAACVFWFFNAMNHHEYTDVIRYPLEIVYEKDKVVPVKELPSFIKINVSGKGWNFLRKSLHLNSPPIQYKPQGLPHKKFITASEIIKAANQELEGIKVNYLMEDTIYLDFDFVGKRSVPLKLDPASFSLASGQKLAGQITLNPSKVTYTGSRRRLKDLPDSIPLRINRTSIKGDFDEEVRIDYKVEQGIAPNIVKTHVSFHTQPQ